MAGNLIDSSLNHQMIKRRHLEDFPIFWGFVDKQTIIYWLTCLSKLKMSKINFPNVWIFAQKKKVINCLWFHQRFFGQKEICYSVKLDVVTNSTLPLATFCTCSAKITLDSGSKYHPVKRLPNNSYRLEAISAFLTDWTSLRSKDGSQGV